MSRNSHDFLAVLATIESLDLPDVWLDMGVLHLLDSLDHQSRTKLNVVGFLVAFEPVELRFLRRYKELKQELAMTLVM